jgi:hypothetical protein
MDVTIHPFYIHMDVTIHPFYIHMVVTIPPATKVAIKLHPDKAATQLECHSKWFG